MKQKLLCVAASILALGSAHAHPDHNGPLRLRQLILPEFKLTKASLHDAIRKVEEAWSHLYPAESFPVAVLEPQYAPATVGSLEATLTCDLKQVSAYEAVNYIANQCLLEIHPKLDLLILDGSEINNWESIPTIKKTVTDDVIAALHLKQGERNGHRYGIRKVLENYGIQFQTGANSVLLPNNIVVIRNTFPEIYKAKALLLLMDEGCELRKPAPTPTR
jgi:hypothetical protein